MFYLEDAVGARLQDFKAHAVVTDAQPEIARAFQAFDVAETCIGIIGQCPLPVYPPQVGLSMVRPAKVGLQDALLSETEFPKDLFMRCAGTGFTPCGFNGLRVPRLFQVRRPRTRSAETEKPGQPASGESCVPLRRRMRKCDPEVGEVPDGLDPDFACVASSPLCVRCCAFRPRWEMKRKQDA
jgi:hypothetical protein